nr:hypothetical protein [Tanacetum cinerariifolium]
MSISYPVNDIPLTVNHNAYMASSSIPQIDYALIVHHSSEFSSPKTGLVVLAILTASVQKCLESSDPFSIVLAASMRVMLQKLVSQLEIHKVSLSQEDVNLKFLRSLPSEWKTHTLIWRNKANLEEHSLDDLFKSLESVEARLVVYKQNESILQENINIFKNEVEARDSVLITLKQKLNQAEKERDDLKLKFDKFQTSSKSLTELLANQTNSKHGLRYYSESDFESLSLSSLSDRSQPSGEYHVVPPPITGNFMPPKPDLVFHTALIAVETAHSAFTV